MPAFSQPLLSRRLQLRAQQQRSCHSQQLPCQSGKLGVPLGGGKPGALLWPHSWQLSKQRQQQQQELTVQQLQDSQRASQQMALHPRGCNRAALRRQMLSWQNRAMSSLAARGRQKELLSLSRTALSAQPITALQRSFSCYVCIFKHAACPARLLKSAAKQPTNMLTLPMMSCA